jgi:3-deoxy-D-manno-octulosonic acid (KDO) 8-phosphate synthase
MTVLVKALIAAKQAENIQTTQYTATNCRAIIDKFTATNTSANNVTISVNLVTSGDTAGANNLVVDARAIAPDETYTFPELVGQVLEPGGFISTIASAAVAVTIRASGREIT